LGKHPESLGASTTTGGCLSQIKSLDSHPDRLSARPLKRIKNPGGYLFRVGQSRTRQHKEPPLFVRQDWHEPWIEPALGKALAQLSEQQRLAVVLVHAFDWTMRDVGDLTGTKVPTVQTHLNRGLARLRTYLEVDEHA
jgi:DNA-directed RNA polymerase specialized sigma24 family protein